MLQGMTQALVIGASGGIGRAVAQVWTAQGLHVTGLSRSGTGFDLRDPGGARAALAALGGPFDRVFVATGVLAQDGARPEKALGEIDAAAMADVLAVNTIGTAVILSALPQLLPKERPASVGVLTARVGSIGDNHIGGWHSYRASKAAANMLVRGAAIELARTHKLACLVALHPGTVETEFTAAYRGRHAMVSAADAAENLTGLMARLGPDQTGTFYDYAGKEVPW